MFFQSIEKLICGKFKEISYKSIASWYFPSTTNSCDRPMTASKQYLSIFRASSNLALA